ncbi:MAG TPA: IS481 family transposase [Longimicrobium sp.]|nr:IS481 family transposase [Longimicrobium sp.]
MIVRLHKNATTTPAIRKALQAEPASVSTNSLTKKYGLNARTVNRWRRRTTVEDASHRPKQIVATLDSVLEEVVIEMRCTLLLPLDDLLVVVRQFICPTMSRSALDRLLRRRGVSSLREMLAAGEEAPPAPKRFKQYDPGFVHVDIKYLPRMPGEEVRRYLYVAIDRCTRWVYHEVLPDKEAATAAAFLGRAVEKMPMKIKKLLTDNGPEFTDPFVHGRERTPTGKHVFDRVCAKHGIEHRLIRPWHPQTNGMVERYNGRVADQLKRTRFGSGRELEEGLDAYSQVYLFQIPQRALGHRTPFESLIEWFDKQPALFHFDPHNLPGLDIYNVGRATAGCLAWD